ncbi:sulfide dehydrogenase [flavocytochrome c] flavoprotein subunit [Bradyrhizobium sp. i1.4.4]
MTTRPVTRRNAVLGITAAAATLARPSVPRAQSAARIVVVGGGFGGAACARALKRAQENLQIILIEPNAVFTSCPFSNEVIAGLREIDAQQFDYDKLAAEGITVIGEAVTTIEPQRRSVVTTDGVALPYDRLVLSPGIDFHFEALPGYDEAASEKMPHAWKAGAQTLLLRRQLEAMADGGTVAIAIPANPSRCPPAPYERASLIAHYLKTKKPRSKVLVLDAKDNFSQQRLFEKAWKELYGDMIERIALSQGGRVTSVDPSTRTIITEFGNYTPDVANVIPPQRAGRIAEIAGAADATGWCPIDPVTFESKLVPNIHVIGDAWPRRRHSQIGVGRERTGQGLRRRHPQPVRGPRAGDAAADRRLLQHGRARLRLLARRQLPAQGRHLCRGRGRRDQPGRCAARAARPRGRGGRTLVSNHHGGHLWLEHSFISQR